MKKNIHFNLFKVALLLITVSAVTACTNNQQPEDTKDIAEDHNEAKFDNTDKEKDAKFLVNAAEINLEEIHLGQLAQQNSNMSDVKELGMMMEQEHIKSLTDLTALADKKMITIPRSLTDDAIKAYDKLNKKSGKEFDEEYCEMMVDGHKKAISLFEKALTESTDSEIQAWASATLPILRTHLDHSISCQKKCENIK